MRILAILLLATATYGGITTEARRELSYRAYFVGGATVKESRTVQPLPRLRRIWYCVSPNVIETADGVPDGVDAVIINGIRVPVRDDGRAL